MAEGVVGEEDAFEMIKFVLDDSGVKVGEFFGVLDGVNFLIFNTVVGDGFVTHLNPFVSGHGTVEMGDGKAAF